MLEWVKIKGCWNYYVSLLFDSKQNTAVAWMNIILIKKIPRIIKKSFLDKKKYIGIKEKIAITYMI